MQLREFLDMLDFKVEKINLRFLTKSEDIRHFKLPGGQSNNRQWYYKLLSYASCIVSDFDIQGTEVTIAIYPNKDTHPLLFGFNYLY